MLTVQKRLRLREGRCLDQSYFQVITGEGRRSPDSPSCALWEGTPPPVHQGTTYMCILALTIWFLAVLLNDMVDLSVQFFVFSGYLNGKNRGESILK